MRERSFISSLTSPSKGHGISRAIISPRKARTLLPQAGAQPQAKRPNCLPRATHKTQPRHLI